MGSKAKAPLHDITVVLLDVGSSMAEDLDQAKQVVDWIISRKIFTNSLDEVRLVLAGCNERSNELDFPGIYVHTDVFQRANFDLLRFLNREVNMGDNFAELLNGVIVCTDLLRSESDGRKDIEGLQLVVVSNGETGKGGGKGELETAITAVKQLGVDVVVIGCRESVAEGKSKGDGWGEELMAQLADKAEAQLMTFKEASNGISHFSHVSKAKRAAPFVLELAPSLKIPVKSYVKTKYNPKAYSVKFVHPEGDNENVVRERIFVKVTEGEERMTTRDEGNEDDEFTERDEEKEKKGMSLKGNTSAPSRPLEIKTLQKNEIIKGFMFGKTQLTISDEEIKEHSGNQFRDGKCLQVVQFTKGSQLNTSHLIGKETRVFIVDEKASPAAHAAFTSIVRTCHDEDTVMVVRYAYSRAANPCLLALRPYEEESGNWALAGVRMAFYEDIRPLQFPPLDDKSSRPTSHQLQLVDDLIDGMDLDGDEGTKVECELILQPCYQRICAAARKRAMDKNSELEEGDGDEYVHNALRPSSILIQRTQATFEQMKDADRGFELIKREKTKRMSNRLERVPENIDDLLEEIEKRRLEEEMNSQIEEKPKAARAKLTFKDKAIGMKDQKDFLSLRIQIETVLDAAEDDNAFFPRVSSMLSHLREGAIACGLSSLFDQFLIEMRDAYWTFAEWMAQRTDNLLVNPIDSSTSFWAENKDVKPF